MYNFFNFFHRSGIIIIVIPNARKEDFSWKNSLVMSGQELNRLFNKDFIIRETGITGTFLVDIPQMMTEEITGKQNKIDNSLFADIPQSLPLVFLDGLPDTAHLE